MAIKPTTITKVESVFLEHGGTLRISEALRQGLNRSTLYAMVASGHLERLARGLYRLPDLPSIGNPDLVMVSQRVPSGVICLISALAFHGLTTQVPHVVWIAMKYQSRTPHLDYPPIRIVRFKDEAFSAGVETHKVDQVPVKIYSREKTIADCFKFRNKLGPDVAREALRLYVESGDSDIEELLRMARICRIQGILKPYLEALL